MKFYEVQKNIILTEHVIDYPFVMINEAKFQKLGKELQDILINSINDARLFAYGIAKQEEAKNLEFFKEEGLNIITIEKEEWMKAFSGTPDLFEGGREMYDKIQEVK